MKRWNSVGIDFERVYYSDMNTDYNKYTTGTRFIEQYTGIQAKINELRQKEGPDAQNFMTDLIHLICIHTCLRRSYRWIEIDKATV
jgi:hypothetical protein